MTKVVIGPCELYRGDCLELLPTLAPGSVDAVVTDPPYGDEHTHAGHLSGVTLRSGEPARQALRFGGLTGTALVDLAREFCTLSAGWVVMSCEWKHAHLLDSSGLLVRLGIWRKRNGAPQFTGDRPGMGWEAVAICHRGGRKRWNGGGKHAFWDYPKTTGYGHPTEKPAAMVREWLTDFTDAGDLVLDPFLGSGTTAVACVQTGRRCVGVELDERYFDIACRRVEKAVADANPPLFAALEHEPADLFPEAP